MEIIRDSIVVETQVRNELNDDEFYIESAGLTYPYKDFCVERDNSRLIVIEYVLSGSGFIELCDNTYYVTKGNCYIIPNNVKHKYYADKHDPFTKMWINVEGNLAHHLLKYYFREFIPIVGKCNITEELNDIFMRLNLEPKNLQSDMLNIYIRILDKIKKTNSNIKLTKKDDVTITTQMIYYINNHIFDEFSIDILSNKFYLSKTHIIRLFKREHNITPYKYYINTKIDVASKMLCTTNLSIDDIAYKLRFSDRNYFSNIFKQITGLTPAVFRKSKKQ